MMTPRLARSLVPLLPLAWLAPALAGPPAPALDRTAEVVDIPAFEEATTLPATRSASTRPATAPATLPATRAAATQLATPPEVAALLKNLAADTWATRERAQRDLVALGPTVRPFVEQLAATASDAEARTRAAAVLRALEREAKFGETRVTLHYKNAEPKAVMDDLSRQAGGEAFSYQPPPDPWKQLQQNVAEKDRMKVTADADRQPFWPTVLRVAAAAGVQPAAGGYGNRAGPTFQWSGQINPGAGGGNNANNANAPEFVPPTPTCFTGPFMVQAVAANYQLYRNVNFANNAGNGGNESLSLQLQVYAEPKLRVLTAAQIPTVSEAVDGTGKSLLPAGQNQGVYFQQVNGWGWSANVQLDPAGFGAAEVGAANANAGANAGGANANAGGANPPAGGRVLKTLKGTLQITVATGTRTLSVPNLLGAVGQSFALGGYQVAVVKAERKDGPTPTPQRARRGPNNPNNAAPPEGPANYLISLRITGTGPDGTAAAQDPQLRQLGQSIEVRDADGSPLNQAGYNLDTTDQELQLDLTFRTGPGNGYDAGPPATLVWDIPTGSEPMDVPFEFHDLPLP